MADTSLDQTRSELAQATDAGESLAGSLADLNNLSKTFGLSITTAFKGAVVQGKSLDTVLRSIGERLTGRALDAALAPLSGALASGASSLMGSLTKALGFAHGGVFAGGRVTPFASGGVVAAPTWFPMRGGAGLMGEAGPEAIVPLSRGADGRLGIAAHGGHPRHHQRHHARRDELPPLRGAGDEYVGPRRRTGTARALTPDPTRRGSGSGVFGLQKFLQNQVEVVKSFLLQRLEILVRRRLEFVLDPEDLEIDVRIRLNGVREFRIHQHQRADALDVLRKFLGEIV